ncbi:MAG: S-adenosylmethionine synthase, partial [Candidatus Freyarchaeota archaeon]|nr:S-adenosylmethionine synthase [Candidatus Jordarchaeia archaeon]
YRPMTLEATAGKNPVSHVGKTYNIAARKIVERLIKEEPSVEQAFCYIVS